jgi:excinuclease ABC subunit C
MRQALEAIKRLYTVRSCRYDLPHEAPARPCLDYHIGRCQAPCIGLQTQASYRAMIDDMQGVLAGRVAQVRDRVLEDMEAASRGLDFERAATLRDVLAGLDNIERRQRALDVRGRDVDVLGIARDGDRACAVQLRIRDGKLLGRELDFFDNVMDESDAALAGAAAGRVYLGRGEHGLQDLPREVLFPEEFEDRATVEQLLTERAGHRVSTHVPVRGDKLRLVELASQNARHLLEEHVVLSADARTRADDVLYEVQEALGMKVVPRLAVCFDISHMQGSEVVGSAIAFRNGEPDKNEYRRFRIRGEWGNDDFRSMDEIVGRYLRRRLEEELPLPQLVLIDGGRGQLAAAVRAAAAAGVTDTTFASLAKREEEIYLAGRPDPIRLPRNNRALRFLQRLRDEAHRFAHGYNRVLRSRRTLTTELDEIPGIGPKRTQILLQRFGSVRRLREASIEEIAALPRFSRSSAEQLLARLRR